MDDVSRLYDYAVSKPEGFIVEDAVRDLSMEHSRFNKSVRDLRLVLAEDEINLVCDPQGQRERWIYRLVGTSDDARPWVINRVGDTESRLETMHAVARTCVTVSDGRSIEGRKARLIQKTTGRLIEDLAEINEN